MYACVYIYAASGHSADFPVFENKIEESKQLDPHILSSSLQFTHWEKDLQT